MTLKGTAGVCLNEEIEMLVSNIELISQSMNKLSEHVQIVGVFFPLAIAYICEFICIKRTCYPDTMYKSVRGICFGFIRDFIQGND